jgi:ABC-type histidine transport system ATPase subunit
MSSKPLAIFILGGSASGKSSFVRDEYIGTLDAPDAEAYIKPVDGFKVRLQSHQRGGVER